MKSVNRSITATLAVSGLLAALSLSVGITSASAAQQQICEESSQLCLNDQLGVLAVNNPVQMWGGGKSNEDFHVNDLKRCNNSDKVLSTSTSNQNCPFARAAVDELLAGDTIVQLQYGSTDWCVGVSSTAYSAAPAGFAALEGCNNAAGKLGGAGTIFVEEPYSLGENTLISLWGTNNGFTSTATANALGCLDTNPGGDPAVYTWSDVGCELWLGL